MFIDHTHTATRYVSPSQPGNRHGKKSRPIGNIFGTRLLRLLYTTLSLVTLSLTSTSAQVIQPFFVQEFFGVSHPDQILDFSLSNSVNPALSYVIGPGGTEVPYQLLRGNRIAFRTDLPANSQRSWQLLTGRAPASFSGGVQITETSEYYEVVNGITGVRVV